MNARVTISESVRRAITGSALSRYEIAKRSGVGESVLSRFCRGERSMSLETLDRLADVLHLEMIVAPDDAAVNRTGRTKARRRT